MCPKAGCSTGATARQRSGPRATRPCTGSAASSSKRVRVSQTRTCPGPAPARHTVTEAVPSSRPATRSRPPRPRRSPPDQRPTLTGREGPDVPPQGLLAWTQTRVLDGNNPTHPENPTPYTSAGSNHSTRVRRRRRATPRQHPPDPCEPAPPPRPQPDRKFSGPAAGDRRVPNEITPLAPGGQHVHLPADPRNRGGDLRRSRGRARTNCRNRLFWIKAPLRGAPGGQPSCLRPGPGRRLGQEGHRCPQGTERRFSRSAPEACLQDCRHSDTQDSKYSSHSSRGN